MSRSCGDVRVTYSTSLRGARKWIRARDYPVLSWQNMCCVCVAEKWAEFLKRSSAILLYTRCKNTMRWTGVPFRVRLRPMPSVVPCFPVRSASTRATSRECIRKPSTGNELTETWQGINTNNELITVLSLCLFTDGLYALLSLTFSLSFYVTVTSGY